jgi:hypothetical protein
VIELVVAIATMSLTLAGIYRALCVPKVRK